MGNSIDFIPLRCTTCGARLEIRPEMSEIACAYCGTLLAVERRGGTVALSAVTTAIGRVQVGTDKTASELAMRRLNDEISQLKKNKIAWMEFERSHDDEWKERLIYGIGSIAIFSIGFFLLLFMGSASILKGFSIIFSGLVTLILIVVSIAILIYIYIKAMNRIKEEAKKGLEDCNNAITQLLEQIKKHREIAES